MGRETALAAGVWVVAIVAIVFLLRAASQLLIPIVIAVLISYALEPLVAWLHAHRIPRLAGAGLLLTSVLTLALWGAYSLRDDAVQALESLPEAARRARELVWSYGASSPGQRIKEAAAELQQPPQADSREAPPASPPPSSGPAGSLVAEWVQQGIGSMLTLAGHVTVIFFLVFFLPVSGEHGC